MIGVLAFLTTGFWMLMIFDCVRNDPERNTWLWILIFLNFPGAVIYFLFHRLPQMNLPMPNYFKRWTLRQALWKAEAAVKNIGKAHQDVALGNVLSEIGDFEKAINAYQQALDKDPKNPNALWGLAFIEMQQNRFSDARTHLELLIALDADYKCGEASLLYGRALFELQDWQIAKTHLEKDVKYWSHPESCMMLATIQQQEGDIQAARNCLETMLAKVKASPTFHYRKNLRWVKKAEKMLRNMA
ncbi:MAG: tetratricopeptide repeat protein [Scytolyngbya sp. HA4215-MV1]|jgi:hypothetical protein|nr:tetratricopeptide repeat protein [Scytolyngbya sp. HA4215-MV1]